MLKLRLDVNTLNQPRQTSEQAVQNLQASLGHAPAVTLSRALLVFICHSRSCPHTPISCCYSLVCHVCSDRWYEKHLRSTKIRCTLTSDLHSLDAVLIWALFHVLLLTTTSADLLLCFASWHRKFGSKHRTAGQKVSRFTQNHSIRQK